MTIQNIMEMLKGAGIPFAYDHFAEGESPNPPFICYLFPGSDNFAADGKAYFKINDLRIELYTDKKVRNGRLRFVFEDGIGKMKAFGENEYGLEISKEQIVKILEQM